MNNRNLLIGAGVLVVGYLLYKKSKNNVVKADVPLTSTIDVNTIPDSFVIKSDGYNTTYNSGFMAGGNKGLMYWKISSRTDGSDSMGSPTYITAKEFEDAYKEFLKQPK
jgi:hypothetical protein